MSACFNLLVKFAYFSLLYVLERQIEIEGKAVLNVYV